MNPTKPSPYSKTLVSLEQLSNIKRSVLVYKKVENIFLDFEEPYIEHHIEALNDFFTNDKNKWKSIVLSCMADLEFQLDNHIELQQTIFEFLDREDEDLARSAALVLESGGEQSTEKLYSYFKSGKNFARSNSLQRLIKLSSNQ